MSYSWRVGPREDIEVIQVARECFVAALGGGVGVGAGDPNSVVLDVGDASLFELGDVPVEGVSPASVVGAEVGLGSAVQASSNQIVGVINVVVGSIAPCGVVG